MKCLLHTSIPLTLIRHEGEGEGALRELVDRSLHSPIDIITTFVAARSCLAQSVRIQRGLL